MRIAAIEGKVAKLKDKEHSWDVLMASGYISVQSAAHTQEAMLAQSGQHLVLLPKWSSQVRDLRKYQEQSAMGSVDIVALSR